MPLKDSDLQAWFEEELQPHEPMLRAWLSSQFVDLKDIEDTIQESYLKLIKAHEARPIASPKAYLFVTARNSVLMRMRKSQVRKEISLAEIDAAELSCPEERIPDSVSRSEELELLKSAIQSLPKRCRQIITLRKIYGMPQREIAQRLGISESTVEGQGTIGVKKLTAYFRSHQLKR